MVKDKGEGTMIDPVRGKRKWITGTNAVVVVATVIGIAIFINAIAAQIPFRLDLTENQIYTLSGASKDAVKELDQPVQVHVYISQDLPAPMHNLHQRIRDLLTEYRAASNGKLTFQVIAPGDSKQAEKNAKADGCKKVAIGQRSEDQMTMRAVFKCVAFIQGQQSEVIEDIQKRGKSSRGNFEYQFTKALLNLQEADPRRLGFVSGFGGPTSQRGFLRSIRPTFKQMFGDLIKVEKVDLSNKSSVPDKMDALILLNPAKSVSKKAKYALDQFLQNGGSVGWYQSATKSNRRMRRRMMQQMGNRRPPSFRKPLNPGLQKLVESWGIKHRKDLVLDRQNATTGITFTSKGLARVSQPATFTMTDIDHSLPFMKSFTTLALPAPSSLVIQPSAKENKKLDTYKLIRTAPSAVRRSEPPKSFSNQELRTQKETEKPGPFTVAAAAQGQFKSHFADKPAPAGVEKQKKEKSKTSASGRLLVVGSGNFYRPQKRIGYSRRLAQLGGQFFISSMEWLVQDTSLTKIRSKALPRLIGNVPYRTKRTIQFVNIAVVPMFFGIIGIGMYYRRRNRKKRLSEDV
jgi:gliding-associated putative ABC transporter substrate-binding component GldG